VNDSDARRWDGPNLASAKEDRFKMVSARNRFLFAALVAAGCLVSQLNAQTTCTSVAVPELVRSEGNTELTGDLVLECTGGVPTPANDPVPQMNFRVILNSNATSQVTATVSGANFNEALLLVDEPNQPVQNVDAIHHKVLNCGQAGAPDTGAPGPGVCEIISTGNPAQTYDGTPGVQGSSTAACSTIGITYIQPPYGCGRPNVFQGRVGPTIPGQSNEIDFIGVPFDPPAAGGTRTLRFTNIRVNAEEFLGLSGGAPISLTITQMGNSSFTITTPTVQVGFAQQGLMAKLSAAKTVRFEEGFSGAWKPRNLADSLANSTYSINYTYIGTEFNPADLAQNVPGVLYHVEEGFQWNPSSPIPSGISTPPSPSGLNPPPQYGPSGFAALDTSYPLNSVYTGTGISKAGETEAGTRLALQVTTIGKETVTVPTKIFLYRAGGGGLAGVMVLVTGLDPNGAGPYTAAPGSNYTFSGGTLVYEVLYSDPFAIEYADVPFTISSPGVALVTTSFAPFYASTSARFPTPTAANPTPVAAPRFTLLGAIMLML